MRASYKTVVWLLVCGLANLSELFSWAVLSPLHTRGRTTKNDLIRVDTCSFHHDAHGALPSWRQKDGRVRHVIGYRRPEPSRSTATAAGRARWRRAGWPNRQTSGWFSVEHDNDDSRQTSRRVYIDTARFRASLVMLDSEKIISIQFEGSVRLDPVLYDICSVDSTISASYLINSYMCAFIYWPRFAW